MNTIYMIIKYILTKKCDTTKLGRQVREDEWVLQKTNTKCPNYKPKKSRSRKKQQLFRNMLEMKKKQLKYFKAITFMMQDIKFIKIKIM